MSCQHCRKHTVNTAIRATAIGFLGATGWKLGEYVVPKVLSAIEKKVKTASATPFHCDFSQDDSEQGGHECKEGDTCSSCKCKDECDSMTETKTTSEQAVDQEESAED